MLFGTASGEARSPWVEARIRPPSDAADAERDYRVALWNEAKLLLRERTAFPWEVERVKRSIARAPEFEQRNNDGELEWVTHLSRSAGCLIGEPIVTDPACER